MACSVPHTIEEIKAIIQKQIDEAKVRQLAIMNLAVEYDNACTAKGDMRKAYEECNDIPQEKRDLIVSFLNEESEKDYGMHNASQILNQGPTSGIRAFRETLRKKNHYNHKQLSPTILYKMSNPANDDFSQHLSDGEESNHEDASDTGAAPKPQQQMIPQTTAISNIKLPILKKEEYDIWAMEMEHYLEYIDNEVWKVIQNGNSKKRISVGKDGVVRVLSPVSAAEIQAVEKERKAKNILLMAIPKEHMRRFHGMDDAKEIWEAIRTRFGGNANSKKMQKAVFKQQFEAFKISNSEGLEKGYDRFQQLLSQLEAHGAEVSTEDANHKFLRSLPSAWSNLAMTMRTNPEIDNLSIDDLYNNLRVFEQEIQGAPKPSSSAQNVAFVSQSKSSTNKVKSGFSGAYSSCTPSTSSTSLALDLKPVLVRVRSDGGQEIAPHRCAHLVVMMVIEVMMRMVGIEPLQHVLVLQLG
ncbi:hypothetical protein Tco_1306260 [Tanacetum coccineum]